jgi:protocatechuate 3,4-dioxygenase beta subunit
MKRRNFIRSSSLVAFSVGVFGNIKWDGIRYVGETVTTTDILGPFYRPGAPMVSDLVKAGTKGEIVHFGGTIFEKNGKTPVKNALVEIWHCNEDGVYDNTSDDYVYRAAAKTAADGKYHFRTIMPVPYNAGPNNIRPAHFHMRISGTKQQDLVTQVYFKGDKYNETDQSASDPRSVNRILPISQNAKNEKVVNFDIVLQDEYILDAAAFKKIAGLYEMSDKTMCEFYRQGDQLFVKLNGQIMEAMDYKGDNSFEGGLGMAKAKFDFATDGSVKVKIDYTIDKSGKTETVEGAKLLKYS